MKRGGRLVPADAPTSEPGNPNLQRALRLAGCIGPPRPGLKTQSAEGTVHVRQQLYLTTGSPTVARVRRQSDAFLQTLFSLAIATDKTVRQSEGNLSLRFTRSLPRLLAGCDGERGPF
jgi:hypothetical protein